MSGDSGVWHPLARLPDEWHAWLREQGEPGYRADQIFQWLHRRGELRAEAMSNLGHELRQRLCSAGLAAPGEVLDSKRSADGTRKLLISLEGGGQVECVLIPMTPKTAEDAEHWLEPEDETQPEPAFKRVTLCISTQYGCAMGCVFCASGQFGLKRGLGAHEIVFQVLLAKRYLESDEVLSNLVFMGMGEPLHHYEQTARAIELITHPGGIGMSARRITVSTVGLPQGIRRLGEDFGGKVGLAVSLHAPDDATRSRIIPMNRRYPLTELVGALRKYPLPRRRRITIEYTLIEGVNDGLVQAEQLVVLLKGLRVKVNLIPMNPIGGSPLAAPSQDAVDRFRERLAAAGYSCFVRTRRGDDVLAACGQLALRQESVPLRRGRDEHV